MIKATFYILLIVFDRSPTTKSGILVAIYFNSPEDIYENIGKSHHCKNLKFENFGESQQNIMSPGLILASYKDLWKPKGPLLCSYTFSDRNLSWDVYYSKEERVFFV